MTGDQTDFKQRIRSVLPRWFPDTAPVLDALLAGIAQALAFAYSLYAYAKLQTRIRTASEGWLDMISADFLGTTLPRLANEGDDAFRARILANLFVKGPTRRGMNAVLTLVTGRAPTIIEPSNASDTGGWDGALCWDKAGCWGDPMPFQAFVTAYRPDTTLVSLAEWDAYRFSWDAGAYWSDQPPNAITDAALIAAVESTRALASVVWMRIANNHDTGIAAFASPMAPAPSPAPAPTPAPAPSDSAAAATIPTLAVHPVDWLQIGSYFIDDGVWGAASNNTAVDPDLTRGSASYQYQQLIERSLSANPEDSSIAARFQFTWPQINQLGHSTDPNVNPNYNEVKTYMSVITGAKPGFYGSYIYAGYDLVVRAPDGVANTPVPTSLFPPQNVIDNWQTAGGSVVQTSPSGFSHGGVFPMQLPLTGKTLRSRGKIVHKATVTGMGHVAYDFFLTATSTQTNGFAQSSITHEIMVPLGNWDHYGEYGYRNPGWYDHDWVSPSGVTYHVYYAKDLGRNDVNGNYDYAGSGASGVYPGLRYNFGGLNPNFTNEETGQPRIGWKFIVFQHDGETHPVDASGMYNVDFVAMMAHLATCKDSRGTNVIQNTEYLPSVEVGMEIVFGAGDILIDKYLVQAANTVVAPPPLPA